MGTISLHCFRDNVTYVRRGFDFIVFQIGRRPVYATTRKLVTVMQINLDPDVVFMNSFEVYFCAI